MAPQTFYRVGAPSRSAQIKAANGIAEKNMMQSRQRAGDMVLAPRSIPHHAWGRPRTSITKASTMAATKGNKTTAQRVPFSKPGRIDLIKKGAPVLITLRA